MEQIPKAVEVANISNVLKITFDNGEIRYLRSHFLNDMLDAYSIKEGKGKRKNLLVSPTVVWLGTTIKIESDGTVILNEKDIYTPEELWNNSVDHYPA